MDGVVCRVCRGDQILWVQDSRITMHDRFHLHRIHVVNQNIAVNLIAVDTKVATIVANDDEIPDISPFPGSIERLVDVTVKAEALPPDRPLESQISEAIFESV